MTKRGAIPSSIHPPLPPTPEDDWFCRLRLLRSRRVGIATYRRLLAEHGTAQNALAALPEIARIAGVKEYAPCPVAVIEAELNAGRAAGATLISEDAVCYPAALREIADAPPFLWAIGDTDLLARPTVALVGARNASSLGLRMARSLAKGLGAAGFVIASGLARGVDAGAHLAALDTGTVAVQAGGVDVIYPLENAKLANELAERGLRISELPIGLRPAARHFPARNRIISGMSRATVVVEAAARSGSLITARDALDQGREVLAVPGSPLDARTSGCNMLIRDGAVLVRNAQDVIEALTPMAAPLVASAANRRPISPSPIAMLPEAEPPARTTLRDAANLHQMVLARIDRSPVAEDMIIRDVSASPGAVTTVLSELELDGKITRAAGGLLSRTS